MATCRWCGHVIRLYNGLWWHPHHERTWKRGCRAAAHDRDGGWDDRLDRRWVAEPA